MVEEIYDHATACTETPQWKKHGKSCWDFVEEQLEKDYDGLFASVKKPDERYIQPGRDYFEGPNSDIDHPTYDVGGMVVFPNVISAPVTFDRPLLVTSHLGGPMRHATVLTKTTIVHPKYGPEETYALQGKTDSTLGKIWLLGLSTGDSILADGIHPLSLSRSDKTRAADTTANEFSWSYGASEVGSILPDSISLTAKDVVGSYPLICGAELSPDGLTVKLQSMSDFQSLPTLEYQSEVDTAASTVFSKASTGYEVALAAYRDDNQIMRVMAPDDLDSIFFFFADWEERAFSDSLDTYEFEAAGVSYSLDGSMHLSQAGVLSSSYPVIRTGLDDMDYPVSRTFALTTLPATGALNGDNQIAIDYDLSDVPEQLRNSDLMESIKIFHWDEVGLQWEMVGGDVDTTLTRVSSEIVEAGIYAAFITDLATDVIEPPEDGQLPSKFELMQNYPNPFNPTTKISFSLPRASDVKLEIFNLLGQSVITLYEGHLPAGTHSFNWDGSSVASGVYLYRLLASDFVESKKMMLLK